MLKQETKLLLNEKQEQIHKASLIITTKELNNIIIKNKSNMGAIAIYIFVSAFATAAGLYYYFDEKKKQKRKNN